VTDYDVVTWNADPVPWWDEFHIYINTNLSEIHIAYHVTRNDVT